ncbi:hypothetical protein SAMN06296952_2171 [Oscillospiraceae bacterium]|nr:hypothetical protein SAMN06296952_2171 [Oscillospiraceae bacterium]
MKSIKNDFPNPVLAEGRDDYIPGCYFYTHFEEAEISITDDSIDIPLDYKLVCYGLEQLIVNDQAKVVVNVRSSAASYSRMVVFDNDNQKITIRIPKYGVIRNIEIQGFIVANTVIENFACPDEFNPLYFDRETFEIRKGDILATEDIKTIFVDDSELEKPISSIFNISCNEELKTEIEINYESEKIEIYLNPNLNSLYRHFINFNKTGSLRRYANAIIVYPVLVEIIGFMRACEHDTSAEYDHFKDLRWYRAIVKKAEKYDYSFTEPKMSDVAFADTLLKDIASDAMQSFKSVLDQEANSGETEYLGGAD